MKIFNYGDFENIDREKMGLPDEQNEPELVPVRRRTEETSLRAAGSRVVTSHAARGSLKTVKRSDPLASSCIREYERKNVETPDLTLLQKGTVHLVPKLIWEHSEMSLELTLGESRQYVVRNMQEFCLQMELESVMAFGKQYSIQCTEESFHSDSLPLLRFIMKRYEEVKGLERLGNSYSYNTFSDKLFSRGKRGMNLTPAALDELLSMFADQSVSVCRKQDFLSSIYGLERPAGAGAKMEEGFDRRLYIKDGRPVLPVMVEEEPAGVRLQAELNPLVLRGEHYLYLWFQTSPDCLWRCDGEYRNGMESFLSSLKQSGGELFVAEKDMVRFCGSVLPEIENFTEFKGDVDCLKRYAPTDMIPKVYLDSPAKDVIAAAAKGDYGGILINLYTDEAEDHRGDGLRGTELPDILRNELQEEKLRLRIERWFGEMDAKTGVLYMKGDDDQLFDFVKNGQQDLAKGAEIFITDRYRRMAFPAKSKLAARVSMDSELLKVTFDFEGFPVEELLDALSSYRARRRYHRLSDGAFLAFEEAELKEALAFTEAMHLTKAELARGAIEIPKYRAMYLDSLMKQAESITFDRDSRFRQLIREIHGIEDSVLEAPKHLEPILRDYQKTGFRWLATMARLGFGGILADDMGLGKTLEVISVLVSEAEHTAADEMERGRVQAESDGMNRAEDAAERAVGHNTTADAATADNTVGAANAATADNTVGAANAAMADNRAMEDNTAAPDAEGDGAHVDRILAIVVCPASLVLNWEQEINRFAPELRVLTLMGTASERRKRLVKLKAGIGTGARLVADNEAGADEAGAGLTGDSKRYTRMTSPVPRGEAGRTVVITSYDLLKRDLPLYDGIEFLYHIVDEAQYIKNYGTQNAKAVKGIDSIHRFALTGTPVENRLSELWSIFDFLMPGYLGPYQGFKEEYELPILRDKDEEKAEALRGQIMPFVLRRLKRKVLKELPEKVESVVCVSMEGEQRKLYLSNLAKVKLEIGKEIREGGFESNKIQILAMLTRLRQICCHPALCYENYGKESGKLEACMELIREAVAGGHRVLLFSQFTTMLSIISERLKREKISHYSLTGQTPKPQRQELVTGFNEGNTSIFLISLKAGGTGLNLTGADVVIHYDPWWNEAAQNQATDRAYRIGQKYSVQVYKLVARDTIEEKIIKLQENKSRLADSVIGENSTLLSMLDEKQLEELFL